MRPTLRGSYPRLLALPRALRSAALLANLMVIAIASSLSGGGSDRVPELRAFVFNWGHQALFGALAVAAALAAGLRLPARPATAAVLVLGVALVGLLDEVHQAGVPMRDSSLWDLVSDTLGAVLALLVAGWTARRDGPVLAAGPLLFLAGLSVAWNCIPSFAPNLPLDALLP